MAHFSLLLGNLQTTYGHQYGLVKSYHKRDIYKEKQHARINCTKFPILREETTHSLCTEY